MYVNRDEQLSRLLAGGIDSLDIPEDQFLVAETVYKAASTFLRDYWADSDSGGALYPQGSMRLGTVTQLIRQQDEYDLDMVCRHDIDKSQITKADLKADVGYALEQFLKAHPDLGLILDGEGRRCWTFKHDTWPFHVDILPAIPDTDAEPNGILVTDTEATRWHHSAPIDYADWFLDLQHDEWKNGALRVAARKQMDIEALPRRAFKTTLQRTVQALKRHRDIFFEKDRDNRPTSIIVTTLAALSYEPAGDLFSVLRHVVETMPELVEHKFGRYVIANPVEPQENFADRWIGHPTRAKRFFEWLEAAKKDFAEVGDARGVEAAVEKMTQALGARPGAAAQRALDAGLRQRALTAPIPAGGDRFA